MTPSRRHAALAGAALLYAGAVATGAAAGAAAGVPAILACLMLWTVLLRPAGQWSGPGSAGALRLALTLAVLAALAAVLWAVGQAVARMAGAPPPWAGPAAALAGIALARAAWSPRRAAAMEAFLDDALAQVRAAAPPDGAELGAGYDAVLRPVADLPDDTPYAAAEAAVAAAMDRLEDDWFGATERLFVLLDRGGPHRAGRRGVILWGTDPARVAGGRFGYPMCHAWDVTWADPALLALYAARALPVVQAMPDRWEDYPRHQIVEAAIDPRNGAATNAALAALARALRDATPMHLRADAPAEAAP